MPKLFMILGYAIFFWSNENDPLEPVHVHVIKGVPGPNATKICIVANNNSHIPSRVLSVIVDVVEARSGEIVTKWTDTFGEVRFYC